MPSFFEKIPSDLPEELFEIICLSDSVKIERIISKGHSSPPGFWYDQSRNEFVLLLQGSARLTIDGGKDPVVLSPGDYLKINAHVRHRVEWTDPDCETVWLAVHY